MLKCIDTLIFAKDEFTILIRMIRDLLFILPCVMEIQFRLRVNKEKYKDELYVNICYIHSAVIVAAALSKMLHFTFRYHLMLSSFVVYL